MTSRQPKNYLESILFKMYVLSMDQSQRVEMLERAIVIMAMALASEAEMRETLIRIAKLQAMEDMSILPKVEND